ncbi:MAG: hypothetical protein Q9166_000175 [cf. Caloplaca sp. 2 TL-2023]
MFDCGHEAQLAHKDVELVIANDQIKECHGTIDGLRGQQVADEAKFDSMYNELQRYCIKHPVLEGEREVLKEQVTQIQKRLTTTEEELFDCQQEKGSLQARVSRLTAMLSSSSSFALLDDGSRIKHMKDDSGLKARLAAAEARTKDAVADRKEAEMERDQAVSERKKATEERDRKALSLDSIVESWNRETSDLRKKVTELESTVDHLKGKINDLEGTNATQGEELKSSAAQSEALEKTTRLLRSEESRAGRFEKELEEVKEKLTTTQENATSSLIEKEGVLVAKETKITQLEGRVANLENTEARLEAAITGLRATGERMRQEITTLIHNYTTDTQNWSCENQELKNHIQQQQQEVQNRTNEVEKLTGWHYELRAHVDHLKQVLNDVMIGFGGMEVIGALGNPDEINEVHRRLRSHLNESTGCINRLREVLQEVMDKSEVSGSLNSPKGLEDVQRELRAIHSPLKRIDLTPKMVSADKKELDLLREFKTQMLLIPPRHNDQDDDLGERLRQANAARQLLGLELAQVKNENHKLRTDKISLEGRLKAKTEESEGRSNNIKFYTDSNRGLKDKTRLLEEQRGKLVKRNLGRAGDSQNLQQKLEKRSHGNEGDTDDELSESNKKARNSVQK